MDNDAPLPAPDTPEDAPAAASPAGFWVRGGACAIDWLVLVLGSFLPIPGAGLIGFLVYKTLFLSQGGQTPGKMAAGIRVVTMSGEPLGVGRALARTAAEWLSAMLLCLGYLIAGFSDKRALHDYIAGTREVYDEGVGSGRKAAFALLGVMAVVLPILAIASFVTLGIGGFGKIKSLAAKSNEAATKGNLGLLRTNNSIYYGDTEGNYPATLDALVGPKYLKEIPKAKVPAHMETDLVTAYGAEVCTGKKEYGSEIDPSKLKDTGGWGFVADPKAACSGAIFVDCTHADSKGKTWVGY